ncbi:MAG: hypothetical protein NUV59_00530 [Patescibacteria group bacterium]|nr:hypothetical protein [Patescibacteria group bacterium]
MSDFEKLNKPTADRQANTSPQEQSGDRALNTPNIVVPDQIRQEHLARTARQEAERQAASEKANAAKIAALHQQLGIKNPEQMREEVIQKALEEGGSRMYTSVADDLSQRESAGYQSIEDSRINDGRGQSGIGRIFADASAKLEGGMQSGLSESLGKRGLQELIDIRIDTKPVYEQVRIPGRKGVFGIGGTPEQIERRATGRTEPIKHSEIVKGGKDEPAVRISYFAGAKDSQWKDYSGRYGQLLVFEMLVPASVAKEIEQEIAKDPAVIRDIVGRFAKDKILKDPKTWETPYRGGDPLRPPYDRWDAKTGGRVYVQKEGDASGWHDENIRQVKRGYRK